MKTKPKKAKKSWVGWALMNGLGEIVQRPYFQGGGYIIDKAVANVAAQKEKYGGDGELRVRITPL